VTIGGRVFTLGTIYRRRPRMYGNNPRRLSRYSPGGPLPGGKVEVAIMPSGDRRLVAGAVWAAWAGAPVEGSPEDIGR
jgi:hypothetical protein